MIDEEIINFLNHIIIKAKTKEELIKNLNTYKDFLEMTEISDSEVINLIGSIKNKADKIFELKEYFNTFDVRGIINSNEISKEPRTPKTITLEKHYHHYIRDYSSGCGSSNSGSSGCGSSYSSGCGGDSTYRGC